MQALTALPDKQTAACDGRDHGVCAPHGGGDSVHSVELRRPRFSAFLLSVAKSALLNAEKNLGVHSPAWGAGGAMAFPNSIIEFDVISIKGAENAQHYLAPLDFQTHLRPFTH